MKFLKYKCDINFNNIDLFAIFIFIYKINLKIAKIWNFKNLIIIEFICQMKIKFNQYLEYLK